MSGRVVNILLILGEKGMESVNKLSNSHYPTCTKRAEMETLSLEE
jgi:hypothetical protein